MSVGLLDGGEEAHLEHITPDVVESVIKPVEGYRPDLPGLGRCSGVR
jgi:hypothetical protein